MSSVILSQLPHGRSGHVASAPARHLDSGEQTKHEYPLRALFTGAQAPGEADNGAQILQARSNAGIYAFIAENRHKWPVRAMCKAFNVSSSGFYGWLKRTPSARSRSNAQLLLRIRTIFFASHATYGARRIRRELIVLGMPCGLHRIERLMRSAGLRANTAERSLRMNRSFHTG